MTTPLEDTRAFKAIDLGHETDTPITRVSAGVIAVNGSTVLTGAAPAVTTIELGHASDTTLERASAGVMSVQGKSVYMAAGTDVAVTDGGTGVSTLAAGGIVVGNGTSDVNVVAPGAATEILVGGGAGLAPAWGTDIPTAVTIGSAYITRVGGTDVTVADGGTGASTLADGGLVIGNGTDAVEVVAAGTTSQILVGGGASTAPVWGTDIPTAVTVGTKYVYRADGTDVAVADGGTGASTATGGFDALSPMTTIGDIVYGGASGTGTRLAAGTTGYILTSNGAAAPTWDNPLSYGEMYMYESDETLTIDVAGEYHAAVGVYSAGDLEGFTFQAGKTGAISATSTDAGSTVTITSATHTLSAGDFVQITGTTSYNDTYEVQSADTNTFVINETNSTADEGGGDSEWDEGDHLIAGANAVGKYLIDCTMTLSAGAATKEWKVEPVRNATHVDKASFIITTAGSTHNSSMGSAITDVAVGDRFWVIIKNITDTTNMAYENANMKITRL